MHVGGADAGDEPGLGDQPAQRRVAAHDKLLGRNFERRDGRRRHDRPPPRRVAVERRARPERRLQPARADPPECQQQDERIGDVEAALAEPCQHRVAEALAAGDDPRGCAVRLADVDQRHQAFAALDQPMGEAVRVDDLVDVGNPLRLGHRHRVEGVARRPQALADGIDREIAAEHGVVVAAAALVGGGVAVDHRAGRRPGRRQRALESQPGQRLGEGVAIAMADAAADQGLDDVALEQHRPEAAGQVVEQRGEAVIEIRMDQDLDRLGREQRQRLDRGLRGTNIVAPARQPEGEVLPEIADRRRPGGQRRHGVLERRGHADDEVAEMRRDRRLARQPGKVGGIVEDQPGAPRHVAPPVARITHRPVEADAVAVDATTQPVDRCVDLAPGPAALGEIAIADLGMQHQRALGDAAALVVGQQYVPAQ